VGGIGDTAIEERRGGRLRRAGRVVAVNVAVALGLLGLLEGAVRLLLPAVGPAATDAALVADRVFADATGASPGLRPGAEGESHGVRLRVDARGFLRYAGNDGLPDSTAAWLLLGDSVAMGLGVPPDSSLAGRLALAADSLRVLNPSLLGYAAADYARVLDALLADPALRLARVTVLWCLNDVYPEAPVGEPGHGLRTAAGGLVAALNRHSRLYRALKAAALDRPLAFYRFDRRFYAPHAAPPPPDAAADTALAPHLPAALDRLAAMRDRCAAWGIPFAVAVVPYEAQLRPPAPGTVEGERLPQRVLLDGLRARGIPALDLAPALEAAAQGDPAALYLWSDGIHLSARGHAAAAEAIAAFAP
jgi:lysophospholipase L1-like esterase